MMATGVTPSAIAVDATYIYWADQESILKLPLDHPLGTPTALASGQPFPSAIAVDATSVYWLSGRGPGNVMKVALAGGAPVALASVSSAPFAIALNSTNVYWTTVAGDVMSVPLAGGNPTTLATGQSEATFIAADASGAYWNGTNSSVMKVALGGGPPTVLAPASQITAFAVDGSNAYWIDSVSGRGGGCFLMTVPIGGGTPATLATDLPGCSFQLGTASPTLAAGAAGVFWGSYTGGYAGPVWTVPLGGGSPTVLAPGPSPYTFAVDATNVYWGHLRLDATPGEIIRMPVGGGAPSK
jgi:hypothetical protein